MKIILVLILIVLGMQSFAAIYTVSNTLDTGMGSLRAAIANAQSNSAGLPHSIVFNIPTSDPGFDANTGVWTIVLTDEGLPALTTGYITIDATTQTAFAGNTNPNGPEICINGNQNTVEYCFSIQNSSNNAIKGLIINQFLYGIQIYGNGSKFNVVSGCYIGCNYNGTLRMGNYNGIEIISGASENRIGGVLATEQNLISGNEYAGLRISDSNENIIINNLVGVNRSGNAELHNYDGITVEGVSAGNVIGGDSPNERNITSGNVAYGIDIFGVGCENNVVQGNFIGTDITGNYAIPNTYGLLFDDRSHNNLVGGYQLGEGNLISGNTAFGAYFYNNGTNSNALIGNKIGTDITGTSAIPNETGVHIDGATYANLIDSNLISGNLANGITLFATYSDYNIITRNKIGTDISGIQPLGNGMNGILITQGSGHNTIGGSPELSNIIAFNQSNGVKIESEGSDYNLISCNSFFLNAQMGIELYPADGVNENDSGDTDTGPNNLMNSPQILTITYWGSQVIVSGSIEAANPEATTIELYKAKQNGNSICEGVQYLGSTLCNSAGNWTIACTQNDTSLYYVALAIDDEKNTSEFSTEFPIQEPNAIANNNDINSIFVYPNPCSEQLIIVLPNNNPTSVKIFNATGQLMTEFVCTNRCSLQVADYESGIYYICLENKIVKFFRK